MMKCPKCNKSDEVVTRPDGTKHCLDCGERVAPGPPDATACSALSTLRQKVTETKAVWTLLEEDQYRRGWHHALDRVLELIDGQNAKSPSVDANEKPMP
jgi:anti-sigma factor ChrR (cupin superfamily)